MFVLLLSCVMARCEMLADMRRGGGCGGEGGERGVGGNYIDNRQ